MDDMKVTERIHVGISEFLSSLVNLDVSARNLAQVKGWVESAQEKADNAEKNGGCNSNHAYRRAGNNRHPKC